MNVSKTVTELQAIRQLINEKMEPKLQCLVDQNMRDECFLLGEAAKDVSNAIADLQRLLMDLGF